MTQRILVADYDPQYLAMMQELLLEEGYRDVCAVNQHELWGSIMHARPDLVMVDVNTAHGDDAWTVLKNLRSDCASADIPVVVCSTVARLLREKSDWLRTMHCAILEKPFSLTQLSDAVRSCIGQPCAL